MQPLSAPRLLLFAVTGFCLQPALSAAVTKKPETGGPTAATPYVLFMGADLAVLRERQYYQVTDVEGSELKIQIGKREFFVPTRRNTTGIKVNNSLKLTSKLALLDGLEAGPGYSPANDPKLKFDRESGAAGGAAAVQDLAYGQMISASLTAGMTSAAAASAAGGGGAAATQAAADAAQLQLSDAQRGLDTASQMTMQDRYNVGMQAGRMKGELDEANYDAMEVSFKISSPVELEDPHMVVLFKYQERDAFPGETGLLIHAKALEPVGPKPKYIRIRETGLPVGFKYLDCEVHIYNRGQEVATNKSSKRVELTRAEAQEYLVVEHIGTNKGATVPAIAVPGTVPRERRQQLTLDQLNRPIFAKISKDGALLGAFTDLACSEPLEDQVSRAVLSEGFFKPALTDGQPTEGVARLRLADLTL